MDSVSGSGGFVPRPLVPTLLPDPSYTPLTWLTK